MLLRSAPFENTWSLLTKRKRPEAETSGRFCVVAGEGFEPPTSGL